MLTELEKKLIKENVIKTVTFSRKLQKLTRSLITLFDCKNSAEIFSFSEEKIFVSDTIKEITDKLDEKYDYNRDKFPRMGIASDEIYDLLCCSEDSPVAIANKIIEILNDE